MPEKFEDGTVVNLIYEYWYPNDNRLDAGDQVKILCSFEDGKTLWYVCKPVKHDDWLPILLSSANIYMTPRDKLVKLLMTAHKELNDISNSEDKVREIGLDIVENCLNILGKEFQR